MLLEMVKAAALVAVLVAVVQFLIVEHTVMVVLGTRRLHLQAKAITAVKVQIKMAEKGQVVVAVLLQLALLEAHQLEVKAVMELHQLLQAHP
jgi:hypothetical protein